MLKKILLCTSLLLSPYFLASENMRCDFDSALGEELDKKVSAAREKYSSLCLKCEGISC